MITQVSFIMLLGQANTHLWPWRNSLGKEYGDFYHEIRDFNASVISSEEHRLLSKNPLKRLVMKLILMLMLRRTFWYVMFQPLLSWTLEVLADYCVQGAVITMMVIEYCFLFCEHLDTVDSFTLHFLRSISFEVEISFIETEFDIVACFSHEKPVRSEQELGQYLILSIAHLL